MSRSWPLQLSKERGWYGEGAVGGRFYFVPQLKLTHPVIIHRTGLLMYVMHLRSEMWGLLESVWRERFPWEEGSCSWAWLWRWTWSYPWFPLWPPDLLGGGGSKFGRWTVDGKKFEFVPRAASQHGRYGLAPYAAMLCMASPASLTPSHPAPARLPSNYPPHPLPPFQAPLQPSPPLRRSW